MQSITVLVTVIATSALTLEGISGKPSVDVKTVDVKSLLQSLKALQQDRGQQDRYGSLNNNYNTQPNTYKKQLSSNRQQYYEKYATQKKSRYDNRPPLFNHQAYDRNDDDNDRDDNRDEVTRILERKPDRPYREHKQKLFNLQALEGLFGGNHRGQYQKPANLLGNNDDLLDLDKYSKIYLVLNPQALKQDKDIADLVSQVARGGVDGDVTQYNGFSVDNQLLRRGGVRREMDEPGKRPRARDNGYGGGGGGGGAGGRTAIPYLKHRGDIYERED